MAHWEYLSGCDLHIKSATEAIEAARDNATRAKGYSKRGGAYADKARYSRAFKPVAEDQYQRLFDLGSPNRSELAGAAGPAQKKCC